jgi:peptide deformylase
VAVKSNYIAVQVGNELIRRSLKHVTKSDLGSPLVRECIAKMRSVNDEMSGVGISANQVGYDLRISLIHIKATKFRPDSAASTEKIMINPEITELGGKIEPMWEGCLSVAEAGIFCKVKRHTKVVARYTNTEGIEITEELSGFTAHIAQHEIAHLDGQVFLDLDVDKYTFMSASEYIAMRTAERAKKK